MPVKPPSVRAELAKLRKELDDQSTVRSANALLIRDLEKATAANAAVLARVNQLAQDVQALRRQIQSLPVSSGKGRPIKGTIEDLHLSARPYNALRKAGIVTIQQLVEMEDWQLLRTRTLGRLCLNEIKEQLGKLSSAPESSSTAAYYELAIPI